MKTMKNVNQMLRIKTFLTSKLTLSIFILISCISLQAQNTVKGSVIDQKTSQTIIGASVLAKGTTTSTMTDADGNYVLNVSDPNATLVFSYIGYVKVEEAINGRKTVNVVLKEENNTLDEVVIIGYGTIKKSDMTGAVGGLKASQLDSQSNTNLGSAIQGKIAGVTVESAGGAPGSGTKIQIRGAGS